MRLAEDRFYNTYPCIIITAKGQPDVATRYAARARRRRRLRRRRLQGAVPVPLRLAEAAGSALAAAPEALAGWQAAAGHHAAGHPPAPAPTHRAASS